MNAAARAISQTSLFQGKLLDIRFSNALMGQLTLLVLVLVSAFAVVYSTNLYRTTHMQLQQNEQKAHQMQLHWGQLLLEQASLSRQSRVQSVALQKLDMVTPDWKQAVTIKLR